MKNIQISKDKGTVLIISSLLLLSIMYLTLATINSNLVNMKLTSQTQSQQQAYLGAEAAVAQGESSLVSYIPSIDEFNKDCKDGLCLQDEGKGIWLNSKLWEKAEEISKSVADAGNLKTTPKYLIEYLGENKITSSLLLNSPYSSSNDYTNTPIFRITGKSEGKFANHEANIQIIVY